MNYTNVSEILKDLENAGIYFQLLDPNSEEELTAYHNLPVVIDIQKNTYGIATFKIQPKESCFRFIKRCLGMKAEKSVIKIDSCLFGQLMLTIINFGSSMETCSLVCPKQQFCDAYLYTYFRKMNYLRPDNDEAFNVLKELDFDYKFWLISIGKTNHLGLTRDGPKIMPLDFWIKEHNASLNRFANSMVPDTSTENLIINGEKTLVSSLIHRELLKKWHFIPVKNISDHTCDIVNNFMKERKGQPFNPEQMLGELLKNKSNVNVSDIHCEIVDIPAGSTVSQKLDLIKEKIQLLSNRKDKLLFQKKLSLLKNLNNIVDYV